ncbi:hypothetical protein [Candidatus Sarmatiella mevalonica]|uniref:hypothetical protein n=1 Tax=Candidatus Sarmatiella mevalonica TaxID=2770581 RepID=UPI0019229E58|nr:hypothetical protein [Candidatus Sarmatiella mevalonica]
MLTDAVIQFLIKKLGFLRNSLNQEPVVWSILLGNLGCNCHQEVEFGGRSNE